MNESNDISENVEMNTLTANEAKTQFGELLLKAQRSPVQINKNGKPVVVVISMDEYEKTESLKLRYLQSRAAQAKNDIEAGNLSDGDAFFDALQSGQFD